MNVCVGSVDGKFCPISRSTCPGECLYADVFENIDLGIIVLDAAKEFVVFRNRAATELLNFAAPAADYATIRNLFIDGSRFPAGSSEPRTIHNGNRIVGHTAYNILSRYRLIFLQDVTEKARLMSIAETVTMMDSIGYIFLGIRHEIGNPLNSIKMSLSVLKKNLDTFRRDSVEQYVDRALGEVHRVEYLLAALKNFSIFEKLHVREMDLVEFVRNFHALVDNDLRKDGIVLETAVSGAPCRVRADARALHHVLLNVLTNAADAVKGRTDPKIVMTTNPKDGVVSMVVEDNGCGMTPAQQKDLFKPFHTFKPRGTGLGLVIVKKLLTQMEARIEIDSRENLGTRVTISLPEAADGRP